MMFYRDVKKLVADTCGATAIEYALIGAVVSIAILVAVTQLGDELVNQFQSVTDAVVFRQTAGQ